MNRFAPMLPLILVAACGSEPDIEMENASVGEVAEEMREAGTASFLNPGKWQNKVTLLEMDVPGMPPEARSMMQKAMDQGKQYEHCLTPEQAKKPTEEFFAQAQKNCRYEHFSWGGGKIDMKLNCTTPQGKMTMVQTGEYRPDAYTMDVTQVVETGAVGGPGRMTIKAKVESRRVGKCDGSEGSAAAN